MSLLRIILRKMYNNKGFVIFLFLGLLIASALIGSIPIYTKGVLQKYMIKDLEEYQKKEGEYPGNFYVSYNADEQEVDAKLKQEDKNYSSIFDNEYVKKIYDNRLDKFKKIDSYSREQTLKELNQPLIMSIFNYSTDVMVFKDSNTYCKLQSLSNIGDHIVLVDGTMPSNKIENDIYEVMVTEDAARKLRVATGSIYTVRDHRPNGLPSFKVKISGIFNVKDENDPYWSYMKISSFEESLIINENLMKKDFIDAKNTYFYSGKWYYAIDYHKLSTYDIDKLFAYSNKLSKQLYSVDEKAEVTITMGKLINNYTEKSKQLKAMMWSINSPVIVILFLYIFMVSMLVIRKEQNEISLITSRGGGKYQIVFIYFIEGIILCASTFLFSPLLSVLICKLVGASSGFLQFVDRKSFPTGLTLECYLYIGIADIIFMAALIIPAYNASKLSIVSRKREASRSSERPIWKKYFLDLILIGISIYGYYEFLQKRKVSAFDPLLFFIPVIFSIGIALLFLRIYPYIINGIYKLGKRFWGPAAYEGMIQVGRNCNSYNFLIAFIIMTLSTGIFSACAARTISMNGEDRIKYANGCDMTFETYWKVITDTNPFTPADTKAQYSTRLLYEEPIYEPYKKIDGVQNVTKVFTKEGIYIRQQRGYTDKVSLMAIEPYEFGQVAWMKGGMLPHHINEYLNLLSSTPEACLISKQTAENLDLSIGDNIQIGWIGNNGVNLQVYGIVDYWPSYVQGKDSNGFVIANLPFVQDNLGVEPYKIWAKLKPNATSKAVYDYMLNNKLYVNSVVDTKQDLIQFKNSPFELAINGSMTMGFIISGIICFMGFVLFWVLSLKSRTLQFGVLRALGFSKKDLKYIIVLEQILSSGVAMVMGIITGLLSSKIFVPFMQLSMDENLKGPPFQVVSYIQDRIKVYVFMGITILIGVIILIYMISRMKISNVLKLGED